MELAAIVGVASVGVGVTVFAAWRVDRGIRRGAPRQLLLGYLALMVIASVVSVLLMRAL